MEHEKLLDLYSACEISPAYIRLPQDEAAFSVLRDRLQEVAPGNFLELERLVSEYGSIGTQEGFINGWAWAQATARECLALRKLPVVTDDYGPECRCGNCKWFIQHYRYTGSYPWYGIVGCGHCMDPDRDPKKALTRNPVWRGCVHWAPRGEPA